MIMQTFLDKYPSAEPHDGLVHLGITQKKNEETHVEEWYWGSELLIPNGYWCPGQPGWDSSSQPVLSMRRNTSGGVCFHDTDVVDMRPYICRQGNVDNMFDILPLFLVMYSCLHLSVPSKVSPWFIWTLQCALQCTPQCAPTPISSTYPRMQTYDPCTHLYTQCIPLYLSLY